MPAFRCLYVNLDTTKTDLDTSASSILKNFVTIKNKKMKIVITGSLGNIGRPLSQELIKQGHIITLISSNPERKTKIEHLGANAAIGSLADSNFLTAAFSGADAVYCMIPPNYEEQDQIEYYKAIGESYKRAILETGVKRIVHLSSYGAHLASGTGFIAGAYHVEQILNSIPNIQLTHLRPTYFYYNLLPFISMIKSAGFIGTVYGGTDRLYLVSPNDIASAAAEELTVTGKTAPIRYISSDERSCNEIASVLGNEIGIPDLKWVIISKKKVFENLKNNGLSDEFASKLIELGEAIHNGKLHEDYILNVPVPGKIKLEEFAEEFSKAFHDK